MEEVPGQSQHQIVTSAGNPLPIGGVLVLVAIGLVISLIQNVLSYVASLRAVLDSSIWETVTDPNSPAYHPYWKPALLYEAVTGPILIFLNAAALWFFFRKKRVFPKLVVISIPLFFALMLIGYYLSGFIPAIAESSNYAKQGHQLIVRFIAMHIWIPYFLVSDRVKKTFVR
ncbi:MAG TPA: DUF2569 domain-containing protein [Pyrinomonadaceae bacterium]|nr:DUF2569 domain-containing protein [Pyrinomonadaceae bacterium]